MCCIPVWVGREGGRREGGRVVGGRQTDRGKVLCVREKSVRLEKRRDGRGRKI